jgi:hypothetical protein
VRIEGRRQRRACNELISLDSPLSHSLLVFSAYIETRERERERVESRVNTQNHNEELLKDPSRLVLCITKHTETHTHSAVLMCVREKEQRG